MARIVGVHGIGQQFKGENLLRAEWLPPLRDGLLRVGARLPADEDLSCAFYGDLFRPKGKKSLGEPRYRASDVGTDWEAALLRLWWEGAAAQESDVPGPDASTKLRTPQWVQRALNGLSKSRFFAGIAERLLIFDLKQVYLYLNDEVIRRGVCERVAAAITPDTRVIVAHSLGTLPAYECLCAHPEWPVQSLATSFFSARSSNALTCSSSLRARCNRPRHNSSGAHAAIGWACWAMPAGLGPRSVTVRRR